MVRLAVGTRFYSNTGHQPTLRILGWQCALFDETGLCALGVEPLIDYPFMSPNSPVQASCAERDKQVQDLSAIMLPAVIERR